MLQRRVLSFGWYLHRVCGMSRITRTRPGAPFVLSLVLQHYPPSSSLPGKRHTPPGYLPLLLCQLTEVLQKSTSPDCSILATAFLGKSGYQRESRFKETCQTGKIQFPPWNTCPSAKLCSASRFHSLSTITVHKPLFHRLWERKRK